MKTCTKCKTEKALEDFSKKRNAHSSVCKSCHNEYYKNYWKNSEAYESHKARVNAYRKANEDLIKSQRYGISLEDFLEIKEKSQGLCMICGSAKIDAVDHCHTTGRVRGLLCKRCNVGLGYFKDDVMLLQKAINYLQQ